ncbi:hypothetical protein F4814DRAFT_433198 [Daldinia grandis]|nr:hypothetical protein F4814DRAFT_433198 [Daldinia grandis]
MSESFASNQKMDSDIPPDDDDPSPSPSPETKLYQSSSPAMSTSAASPARSDGDRIECLVRRMSKQTFVRESLIASAMESQGYQANSSLPINPEPMQMEIQTPPHISEPSNQFSYTHLTEPPSDQYISQLIPPQHYEKMANPPSDPAMDGNFTSGIAMQDTQQQPEMSPQGRFPNLRRLDLMANMIENEEQCNVYIPRPVTLIPTPRLPSSADPAPSAGPSSRRGLRIPYDNSTVLEVDEGICTQPDEQAPSETRGLREASGPEGIRKLGHLKYRTSLETAMRCKNMRKSAPRMRRRPKTQPKETQQKDSTIDPASTTPTSSTAT